MSSLLDYMKSRFGPNQNFGVEPVAPEPPRDQLGGALLGSEPEPVSRGIFGQMHDELVRQSSQQTPSSFLDEFRSRVDPSQPGGSFLDQFMSQTTQPVAAPVPPQNYATSSGLPIPGTAPLTGMLGGEPQYESAPFVPTERPKYVEPLSTEFWNDLNQTLEKFSTPDADSDRQRDERWARNNIAAIVRDHGPDPSQWPADRWNRANEAWKTIGERIEQVPVTPSEQTLAYQLLRRLNAEFSAESQRRALEQKQQEFQRARPTPDFGLQPEAQPPERLPVVPPEPTAAPVIEESPQRPMKTMRGQRAQERLAEYAAAEEVHRQKLAIVERNPTAWLFGSDDQLAHLDEPVREYLTAVQAEHAGPQWELEKALYRVRNSETELALAQHDIETSTFLKRAAPIVGGLPELPGIANVRKASERIAAGKPRDDDYMQVARFLFRQELMAKETQDQTWVQFGVNIVADALPFMTEFLVTGGTARMATAGIKKALLESVKAGVKQGVGRTALTGAVNLGTGLATAAVQTGLAATPRIATGAEQLAAESSIHNLLNPNQPPRDDSWIGNLPAAATKEYVEVLSERIGGKLLSKLGSVPGLARAGQFVGGKLPYSERMGAALSAIRGRMTSSAFARAGFHGPAEEFLEERFADSVNGLLGQIDYFAERGFDAGTMGLIASNDPRGWKQLKAELFAFGLMGSGHAAVTAGRDALDRPTPEQSLFRFMEQSSRKNYDRLPADLRILDDGQTARDRSDYAGRLRNAFAAAEAAGPPPSRAPQQPVQPGPQPPSPVPGAQAPIAPQPPGQVRAQPRPPIPSAPQHAADRPDSEAQRFAEFLGLPKDLPLPQQRGDFGGFTIVVPPGQKQEVIRLAKAKGFEKHFEETVEWKDGIFGKKQTKVTLGFAPPEAIQKPPQSPVQQPTTPPAGLQPTPQPPAAVPEAPATPPQPAPAAPESSTGFREFFGDARAGDALIDQYWEQITSTGAFQPIVKTDKQPLFEQGVRYAVEQGWIRSRDDLVRLSSVKSSQDVVDALTELQARQTAQPKTVQVGDQQSIGGVDSTIVDVQEIDGVRYELYRHNSDPGGALRVYDVDSGNVVTVKRYPSFGSAQNEHDNTIKALTRRTKTSPVPRVTEPPSQPISLSELAGMDEQQIRALSPEEVKRLAGELQLKTGGLSPEGVLKRLMKSVDERSQSVKPAQGATDPLRKDAERILALSERIEHLRLARTLAPTQQRL